VLKKKKPTTDKEIDGDEEKETTHAKHIMKKSNLKQEDLKKKIIPKYSIETLNKFISALRPFKYHNELEVKLKESTNLTIRRHLLNKFYFVRITDSPQKVLLSSKIFQTLLDFFNAIIQGKTKKKLMILSGFDRNISDVLSNLFDLSFLKDMMTTALHDHAAYKFLIPPLASSMLFELVRDEDNNHYIRFIYNGKEVPIGHFNMVVNYNKDVGAFDYKDFEKLVASRIDKRFKDVKCSNT